MHNERFSLRRVLWLTSLVGLVGSLSACSWFTPNDTNAYANAYRVYESPCVLPEGGHSPTLDVMLLNAMKDRGLTPQLIATEDDIKTNACRIVVRFSVEDGQTVALGVKGMSLFYRDLKTGETYWVGMGNHNRYQMPTRLGAPTDKLDAGLLIRQLVERLFPERLVPEYSPPAP